MTLKIFAVTVNMDLKDTLDRFMQAYKVKPTRKIAVAVSGGCDSMALALLAYSWAKTPIIAITVDHRLRKESKDEAEQVSRWMQKHGIEHHILKWDGEKPPSNIQANAREARYNLLTEFCNQNRIKTLLVAHNKEDQAETLLMRLMRGSGIEGMCGISEDTNINEVRILRPLLDVNKNKLKSYLRKQQQGWIEDPSNRNEKFTRVQVRNFINNSPEPDLLVERLANSCKTLQQSNSYIEEKIKQDIKEVVNIRPEGYCILDIEKFKSLHKESAIKILSRVIKSVGGEYYKPRFEKTDSLYKQILERKYNATLGGCEIFESKKQKEWGKLFIIKENAAPQHNLPLNGKSSIIWDGRFMCSLNKKDISGYYVGALTENGFAELLKSDKELSRVSLPRKIIFSLPALQTLEKIVAAPHISYYENNEFEDLFDVRFLDELLSLPQ